MHVKIYTTTTCPWSDRVRAFLDEHAIHYEELNIAQDHQGMLELLHKIGHFTTPMIDIEGIYLEGFDEEALMAILHKQHALLQVHPVF